jgi:hypothetical protein
LLSLITLDSNAYLSTTTGSWNQSRHTDTKIDQYYAAYARELDAVKRKGIARELQEYMADKLYWNAVSGSPFYQVAQRWMKGYTFNAEFEVHYETGADKSVHSRAATGWPWSCCDGKFFSTDASCIDVFIVECPLTSSDSVPVPIATHDISSANSFCHTFGGATGEP